MADGEEIGRVRSAHRAAVSNRAQSLSFVLDEYPWLIDVECEWHPAGIGPCSLLHHACLYGAVDCVRLLLDRGVAVDAANRQGATPLRRACMGGSPEVVALLLSRGADPSHSLRATVIGAARRDPEARFLPDHAAVIRLLLQDGRQSVDVREYCGQTALMAACQLGLTAVARMLLLEGGADHTLTSRYEVTAMGAAQFQGRQECVELLQWYEAKLGKTYVLSKARAAADATEIVKAMEKHAKSNVGVKKVNQQVVPACLRGRVARGEALPVLELVGRDDGGKRRLPKMKRVLEQERRAVLEHVVGVLNTDLFLDLMAGLRYHSNS